MSFFPSDQLILASSVYYVDATETMLQVDSKFPGTIRALTQMLLPGRQDLHELKFWSINLSSKNVNSLKSCLISNKTFFTQYCNYAYNVAWKSSFIMFVVCHLLPGDFNTDSFVFRKQSSISFELRQCPRWSASISDQSCHARACQVSISNKNSMTGHKITMIIPEQASQKPVIFQYRSNFLERSSFSVSIDLIHILILTLLLNGW